MEVAGIGIRAFIGMSMLLIPAAGFLAGVVYGLVHDAIVDRDFTGLAVVAIIVWVIVALILIVTG